MDDKNKSKKQLINEVEELRDRIRELEERENEYRLLNELDELGKEHSWPEKALNEIEKRYQALIETNLYGIQEIDIYGIITFMNSVQYKILGYKMGELRGKQIWDLLASDIDREKLTEHLTKIAEGEYTSFPWIGRYIRKDGKITSLEVDWKQRQDNHGRITGFVSVISGILKENYQNNEENNNDLDLSDETDINPESVSSDDTDIIQLSDENADSSAASDLKPEQTEEAPEQGIKATGLKLEPTPAEQGIRVADLNSSMELKLDDIRQQLDMLQQAMAKSDTQKDEKEKKESCAPAEIHPVKDIAGVIAPQLIKIVHRIDILHQDFESRLKYDTHKNKIIDNLHKDLQDYKNDFLKKYLKSVIMDVIQIIDNIRKLANHYKGRTLSEDDALKLAELLESIPSDLEDLFYRHGVKPFICEGESFDPTRQRVLKTVDTADESKDKSVAERIRPGYEMDGKVIRPEMITAYIFKTDVRS